MTSVSVTEARATLPDLLDRVGAGEEISLTRHGRVVAVVIHPDALATRRTDALFAQVDELRAMVSAAPRPGVQFTLTPEQADALVAEVLADRHAR